MAGTQLSETHNYREVDARLITAGQPNEVQLADAATQGVQVVINLALHDDPRYSLKDETACVRAAGMEYIHIPVQFAAPTEADLLAFFDAMEIHSSKKVLVHCAANKRVTAFLGLYRVVRQGHDPDEAFALMRSVWEPDEVWKGFIDAALRKHRPRVFEIRQVRQLSPEESHQLWEWGEDIFGTADLKLTYRAKTGQEVRFVLYAEAGPASHVAVLKHHARANGRPVLIGGIGGVVTAPAFQRRGHAARLVRHATTFLREEWKVDFALLFCIDRMRGYYERLGWRKVACEVLIDQPTGKMPSPFHVMAIAFNPEFEVIHNLELNSASW
jgi:uncharacterized protein (TIGR01244 family)